MRFAFVVVLCVAVLAGGCGGDEDGGDGGSDSGGEARLAVVVRPEGPGGAARTSRVECERLGEGSDECRRLRELRADALAPVPRGVACTSIYGGPATARVTGVLRGERVAARFRLTDGCEIERWRRNAELLGPPPRG